MARIFSGIQPSGDLHLGNLLGALKNWVAYQDDHDALFCVVDLHAITLAHNPKELQASTTAVVQLLIAVGIDPKKCILFAQSHVTEHAQLGWMLQCTVSFGELRRMTQFKEKSDRSDFISAGLFTYPALQAADILLYDTDEVPVGADQRQHIELTRDIAQRFNTRYGETFVLPDHRIPEAGARVMDLLEPTNKMSKSDSQAMGTILVLDDPKIIEKKIKRAVTDSETEVRYDPKQKPGISNLLEIISAIEAITPEEAAQKYNSYGDLKSSCTEAVIGCLTPIQKRFKEISADPTALTQILESGAKKARDIAAPVLQRAKKNIGLL